MKDLVVDRIEFVRGVRMPWPGRPVQMSWARADAGTLSSVTVSGNGALTITCAKGSGQTRVPASNVTAIEERAESAT